MGISAIGRGTAIEEQKVKASSGDGSPGFLDSKVDGDTIKVVGDLLERPLQVKVLNVTRDISLATVQAISGVGFRPVFVQAFANIGSLDDCSIIGWSDGVTDVALSDNNAEVSDTYQINTRIIRIITTVGNENSAQLTSFDADGFTLTWFKTGSPTGNTGLRFYCLR